MNKIRILWLSNKLLGNDDGSTGTWLNAMSEQLSYNTEIELINFTLSSVKKVTPIESTGIRQWLLPYSTRKKNGLPTSSAKRQIIELIYSLNPTLIHVWGVENFWGLLTAEINQKYPVLLEIQGLKWTIAPYYFGDLNQKERLRTIRIKEILKLYSGFSIKTQYKHWGKVEKQIIRRHKYISTHSNWAGALVKLENPNAIYFKNERLLRKEFYEALPWEFNGNYNIFTSLAYPAPHKGFFTLIKALVIIKKRLPNVILYVAGNLTTKGFRTDGYIRFILDEIDRYKLKNNIKWLGGSNALKMISELRRVSVSVFPSFVESYGLALAESMALGVPCVVSYNGGYGYLGKDEENVLFFNPGDAAYCAFLLVRVLENRLVQEKLSHNAREFISKNNESNSIILRQISIYDNILRNWQSEHA